MNDNFYKNAFINWKLLDEISLKSWSMKLRKYQFKKIMTQQFVFKLKKNDFLFFNSKLINTLFIDINAFLLYRFNIVSKNSYFWLTTITKISYNLSQLDLIMSQQPKLVYG